VRHLPLQKLVDPACQLRRIDSGDRHRTSERPVGTIPNPGPISSGDRNFHRRQGLAETVGGDDGAARHQQIVPALNHRRPTRAIEPAKERVRADEIKPLGGFERHDVAVDAGERDASPLCQPFIQS
jgi:hypothetical protein